MSKHPESFAGSSANMDRRSCCDESVRKSWRLIFAIGLLVLAVPVHKVRSQTHSTDSKGIANDSSKSTRGAAVGNEGTGASGLSSSLRIVRLLWQAKPEAAAQSFQRTIELALSRGQLNSLTPEIASMRSLLEGVADKKSDPRRAVAIAAIVLSDSTSGEARAKDLDSLKLLASSEPGMTQRSLLMRVWFQIEPQSAFEHLRQLLTTDPPDVRWLQQVIVLATGVDHQQAALMLFAHWNALPQEIQIATIEPLTHKVDSMRLLIGEIRQGRVAKDMVNTNQLRKWLATGEADLIKEIESLWGQIRSTDNAQRQELVSRTIAQLKAVPQPGEPRRGWAVFQRVCAQCHVLHGQGFEVGPNITNNGRGNFEQLVSNVLDPSLVIGSAFQARTVLTSQGQVISGLLVAEDAKRVTLKIQGGKTVELDKQADIEQMRTSTNSLMPEGLEQQLAPIELADLFALLCLVKPPDAAENELIPGTPDRLVATPQ